MRQDVGNAAKPHCRASGRASAFLGGGEIDSERENFLARDTASYGFAASQLGGLLRLCTAMPPRGFLRLRGFRGCVLALGLWGCSERAPLRDDGLTLTLIIRQGSYVSYVPERRTGMAWCGACMGVLHHGAAMVRVLAGLPAMSHGLAGLREQ